MSVKMDQKEKKEKIGSSVVKGFPLGDALQTRYGLIPKRGLSNETVGGIWDKALGKKGKAIIRFDQGLKTGQPHINIDPKGFPSGKNPHIPVPKGVVQGAQALQKTLKYAGPILTVAAVAFDMYRLGVSIKDDVEIRKNADDILKDIDEALEALRTRKAELENLEKSDERTKEIKEINKQIRLYEKFRKEVCLAKDDKIPCKSIKEGSSIAGGWLGGIGGGLGGAWAGTQAGAAIGTLFGPAGTAVGGFVGAIVGSISVAIGAGIGGSLAGGAVADLALESTYDKKYENVEKGKN